MCLALNDDQYSRKQLAALCGVVPNTIQNWLDSLRVRNLVYICEYRRHHNTGQPEEIFKWGFRKKDVERPKPKTQAEYSANYRQRKLIKETMYGNSIRRTRENNSSESEESSGDLS